MLRGHHARRRQRGQPGDMFTKHVDVREDYTSQHGRRAVLTRQYSGIDDRGPRSGHRPVSAGPSPLGHTALVVRPRFAAAAFTQQSSLARSLVVNTSPPSPSRPVRLSARLSVHLFAPFTDPVLVPRSPPKSSQ